MSPSESAKRMLGVRFAVADNDDLPAAFGDEFAGLQHEIDALLMDEA